MVVRKKQRIAGVWVNAQSETFIDVPASYSMATTRELKDIADPGTLTKLSLGPDYLDGCSR